MGMPLFLVDVAPVPVYIVFMMFHRSCSPDDLEVLVASTMDVLMALCDSREKSIRSIDVGISALQTLKSTAVPAAAVAFARQVKVKEQRRALLVDELAAYRAQVAAMQPSLPGTGSSEPVGPGAVAGRGSGRR